MFLEYTYEYLLEEVLKNAPDGIDIRQGSIFYDSISGVLLKIAKLYTDIDSVFDLVFIETATGEYLDLKATEHGITRLKATKAKYNVEIVGTIPPIGQKFFISEKYFTFEKTDKNVYYLQSELDGTIGNDIYYGENPTPINNIKGLESITISNILEYAVDIEDDESLRTRIREKIAGPAENGNKQHYKTWCESVDGVAMARIIPLWNGKNTVKAVLINSLGLPCDDLVVQKVQQYVDPDSQGLGEGVANIGAYFTAVPATKTIINVSFDVSLANGYTIEMAKDEVTKALKEYLKDEVIYKKDDDIVIRLASIGAIILNLDSINDYFNLKINGDVKNITPSYESVAVLGEVVLNV